MGTALLFSLLIAAAPLGSDVVHAADDRAIYQKLERATVALAEAGSPLRKEERLRQCERARS